MLVFDTIRIKNVDEIPKINFDSDDDFHRALVYLIQKINPDHEKFDKSYVTKTKELGLYEALIPNTTFGKKRFILKCLTSGKLSEISSDYYYYNRRFLINSESSEYDAEYHKTLIKLKAPRKLTTGVITAQQKFQIILSIAKKSPKKIPFPLTQNNYINQENATFPDGEGHMGLFLFANIVQKPKKQFIEELQKIAPFWIDHVIEHRTKNTFEANRSKKRTTHYNKLLKLSTQRPRVGKWNNPGWGENLSKDDLVWLQAIRKVWAEKYNTLTKNAPQWAETGRKSYGEQLFSGTAITKKLDILDWAKDKNNQYKAVALAGKVKSIDDLICKSIFTYTNKQRPKNGYDEKFTNALKKIRTEWFDSEGNLINLTETKKLAESQPKIILKKAKNNDLAYLRKHVSPHVDTVIRHLFKKDKQFADELKLVNPFWYYGLKDDRYMAVINSNRFQTKVENLIKYAEKNIEAPKNPGPDPSMKSQRSLAGTWRYIKDKRTKYKIYNHAYELVTKVQPNWAI